MRLAGSRRFWKVLDGSGRFGRFCAYLSYLLHLSYLSYLSDLSYLSYLSYLSNLPSPLTYIYPMFVSNFGILSYPIPPFPMQFFPIHPILPHLSYPIPSTYLSIHLTTYPNLCIYLPICLSMYLAASNLFIYLLSLFPLPVFLPSYLAS